MLFDLITNILDFNNNFNDNPDSTNMKKQYDSDCMPASMCPPDYIDGCCPGPAGSYGSRCLPLGRGDSL